MTSAGTPRRAVLALLLYVTTPPSNDADAPGTEVIRPAMSPPVQDSAVHKERDLAVRVLTNLSSIFI